MAPPASSSDSVSVVLPASGCEMIANVRRRAASAAGELGREASVALDIDMGAGRRGLTLAARTPQPASSFRSGRAAGIDRIDQKMAPAPILHLHQPQVRVRFSALGDISVHLSLIVA